MRRGRHRATIHAQNRAVMRAVIHGSIRRVIRTRRVHRSAMTRAMPWARRGDRHLARPRLATIRAMTPAPPRRREAGRAITTTTTCRRRMRRAACGCPSA